MLSGYQGLAVAIQGNFLITRLLNNNVLKTAQELLNVDELVLQAYIDEILKCTLATEPVVSIA